MEIGLFPDIFDAMIYNHKESQLTIRNKTGIRFQARREGNMLIEWYEETTMQNR